MVGVVGFLFGDPKSANPLKFKGMVVHPENPPRIAVV
jgi:hypothetical protein